MDIKRIEGLPMPTTGSARDAVLTDTVARETAEAFEAAFLAEMLKHTGINRTPESAGGGAGEEAFASFLTDQYADVLARSGGLGIAEQIFNAIRQGKPGS